MNLGSAHEPRMVHVSAELDQEFRSDFHRLLSSCKDVFAWSYTDMRGVDPPFYQHKIVLHQDAVPVRQQRHRMNLHYAAKVKEEIDK